ncbi:hypothetical protein MMC25_007214 [Agyrium rufum]|nr:hypothetical protein [Agyrium rufum]
MAEGSTQKTRNAYDTPPQSYVEAVSPLSSRKRGRHGVDHSANHENCDRICSSEKSKSSDVEDAEMEVDIEDNGMQDTEDISMAAMGDDEGESTQAPQVPSSPQGNLFQPTFQGTSSPPTVYQGSDLTSMRNFQRMNPYAIRANEIGLSHGIEDLGHLGRILPPYGWNEGDDPLSPKTCTAMYRSETQAVLKHRQNLEKEKTFTHTEEVAIVRALNIHNYVLDQRLEVWRLFAESKPPIQNGNWEPQYAQDAMRLAMYPARNRAVTVQAHSANGATTASVPTQVAAIQVGRCFGSGYGGFANEAESASTAIARWRTQNAYLSRQLEENDFRLASQIYHKHFNFAHDELSPGVRDILEGYFRNGDRRQQSDEMRFAVATQRNLRQHDSNGDAVSSQIFQSASGTSRPHCYTSSQEVNPAFNLPSGGLHPNPLRAHPPFGKTSLDQAPRATPMGSSNWDHAALAAQFAEIQRLNQGGRRRVQTVNEQVTPEQSQESIDAEVAVDTPSKKKASRTRAAKAKPWYSNRIKDLAAPTSQISTSAMQAGLAYVPNGHLMNRSVQGPAQQNEELSAPAAKRRRRRKADDEPANPFIGIQVSDRVAAALLAAGARDKTGLGPTAGPSHTRAATESNIRSANAPALNSAPSAWSSQTEIHALLYPNTARASTAETSSQTVFTEAPSQSTSQETTSTTTTRKYWDDPFASSDLTSDDMATDNDFMLNPPLKTGKTPKKDKKIWRKRSTEEKIAAQQKQRRRSTRVKR